MLTAAEIAVALGGKRNSKGWRCLCPAHDDHNPSLDVEDGHSGVVMICRAGCPQGAVVRALAARGLWNVEPKNRPNGRARPNHWTFVQEYVYRDADDQPYSRVCKMLDENGRKQFPQFRWDGRQWVKGAPKSKIAYRLPELNAASPATTIYFCEGERDADSLAKLGFVATTQSGGAGAPWDGALTQHFRNRHVVVLPDADQVGRKYAQQVAKALHGVAASLRVVDLHPDHNDGRDVTDWLAAEGNAGVKLTELVQNVALWQPASDTAEDEVGDDKSEAEIKRLAKLPALHYEQERKGAAERLKVRAPILDRLVQAEREKQGLGEDGGRQGHAIAFPEPEPWPAPVDGATLLDGIAAAIGRHVVMAEHARDTAALWVLHTYLLDHFLVSPRLAIRSPAKRCGKTTLLDVLGHLVLRPLPSANVTAAAIFRVVEAHRPALLVDEADTFLANNDELRGVINSGHRNGGSVLRTVGDDHEPRAFSTYSACAIALIGRLPDTLQDRSVTVDLKRRLPTEAIEPFRPDRVAHLDVLARQAARWVQDNTARFAEADPAIPAGIFNRDADNWRPLLAIADVAGGPWPERARNAVAYGRVEEEEASRIELLLGDIRTVFTEKNVDRIASAVLVEDLAAIEGRPWADYKSGKPLTSNQLARLLKPLTITSENIRVGDKVFKGYLFDRFDEAFARYLGPQNDSEPLHRYNNDKMGLSGTHQTATRQADVADGNCKKPNNHGPCSGVAVAKEDFGESTGTTHFKGGAKLGLPRDEIDKLANWYRRRVEDDEVDRADIDAGLRQAVAEQVPPEHIEAELARVMAGVEATGLETMEAAAGSKDRCSFRIVGPTPPNTTCIACYCAEGNVMKIRRAEPGAKAEPLHEECALGWFTSIMGQ